MKELNKTEWPSISGGSFALSPLVEFAQEFSVGSQSYLNYEAIFGGIALGLFLSPGGWSTTLVGFAVGGTAGLAYSYLSNKFN